MRESDDQYGIVVGDSDTLVLLGGEAQGGLRECSQLLSDISLHDNDNLDILINEIILNMEQFSVPSQKRLWPLSRKHQLLSKSALIKKYHTILDFITKATTALQIQEAQLIKDNEILKYLLSSIEQVTIDLERAIAYAKELQCATDACFCSQGTMDTVAIDNLWNDRLERRIQDMSVSHVIALQMKAQMILIRENNTKLIDKIIAAISGTIPLWQNQISLLLGVERLNRNEAIQDQIGAISSNFHADIEMSKGVVIDATTNDILPEIASVNQPLQEMLRELCDTERNEKKLRKGIIAALQAR